MLIAADVVILICSCKEKFSSKNCAPSLYMYMYMYFLQTEQFKHIAYPCNFVLQLTRS